MKMFSKKSGHLKEKDKKLSAVPVFHRILYFINAKIAA
jgi:hypothetical protein